MPSHVTITRGAGAPTMLRNDVKAGQVFAYKMRDGKPGKNYAAISHNGRYYSVNLATGELASAENGAREVVLTGKWEFEINNKPTPSVVRECRRSQVRSGEVFHVGGKSEQYFNLGSIVRDMEGYLSVPLARTENHAVTRNANSRVNVVATGCIKAILAS